MPVIERWLDAGLDVAVATVVRVTGSAPRPVGAKMIVAADGQMAGSVSGGCVETAVFEELRDILRGASPRTVRFGISDEMSWDVGLACGGTIDVLLQSLAPGIVRALVACLQEGEPTAVATEIGETEGSVSSALVTASGIQAGRLGEPAVDLVRQVLEAGRGEARIRTTETGSEVFVDAYWPPPVLVLIGGVHVAIPLSRLAREFGFYVVVADPRGKFADTARFPQAHEVLVEWPDQALERLGVAKSTYVVVLTHDPKIDEPALATALRSEATYVGAIGSRKTHRERYERMARLGVSREQLGRVYAPIGLDLGGRTAEETALSIMAEIIAVKNGRGGGSLRDGQGPIGA